MAADDEALLVLAAAVLDRRPLVLAPQSELDGRIRDLLPQFQVLAELAALGSSIADNSDTGQPPQQRAPLAPGNTWGPLTILEPIGTGSFGDVYRAIDTRLDRAVALKLLRENERVESVIVGEARLMARVHHPNVVAVYGAERIDGRVGIWMQLVEGRSLEDELIERGPIAAEEVARLGVDLCRALEAIHRAGLLHRDLKAQNVLRDREGRVLVSDFGAGTEADRDDEQRVLAGTPLYLAPELLNRAPASIASDIYALGVLLFHLLTGGYPVSGHSMSEIRVAHREGHRRSLSTMRPDITPELAAVIDRATEITADARFATAREMEAALSGLERPASSTPAVRRKPRVAAVTAALMVALMGGTIVPRIWSTAVAGENANPLTPRKIRLPAHLSIGQPSPDMRVIPYIDNSDRGQLWDVVHGRPIPLTRENDNAMDDHPVVAPDGERIAVSTLLQDDIWELRVLHKGVDLRRPLIARQSAFEPIPTDWSRSGDDVLCWFRHRTGMTELALVPSTGDAPRILHTFKGVEPVSAKLSPDGRFVAATIGVPYADERTDLVLLDVEERSTQLLAERVAPATEPAWTPDGSRVFYLVESTVLDGPRDGWEIPVKAGLPAGPAKKVTSNPGNGSWVVSTANGLLARTVSKVSAEVYTRTLDLTGRSQAGPPQRIAADELGNHSAPSWSPDGRWLAYIATDSLQAPSPRWIPAQSKLMIADASGTRREISTTLPFIANYSPRWFPDGQSVVVWGGDRRATERYGFYKINLLTGSAHPLVVGAGIHPFGELSSNGRLLYYQRALEGLLIARDLESGQERILMSTARDWVYTYRANRDGALAYVRRRKDADGGPVLVVRSPSGSESELLRGGAFDYFDVVDWTPDGNGILYRRAEGTQPSRLWLMPRRGGPPVDLGATLIRGGILDRNVPSLHPNGRALAYQEFVVDSEFWLTPLAQPDGQTLHAR